MKPLQCVFKFQPYAADLHSMQSSCFVPARIPHAARLERGDLQPTMRGSNALQQRSRLHNRKDTLSAHVDACYCAQGMRCKKQHQSEHAKP